MSKFSGFVKLMRPINCLMMSFAVLVGGVLANSNFSNFSWLNILYGALTGFTLTAAAMAANDYYDRDIDAINEPKRPIPSGEVNLRAAIVFAAILTCVGLIFAYLTSILCLMGAALAWIVMLTYTTVGKRSGLPGNFLVSACVAAPFLYGSLAAVNSIKLNVLLFASMAFLSNTGREITKGIVDVKGDRFQHVRTLAVWFGEKKAALVAAAFYIFAVCLSPLPIVMNSTSILYVPCVLVTDVGLVGCSVLLVKNPERENARKIKKLVLVLFMFGLLAYIFGMLK
ncbi:MAG TPA: geranylgeranylglycerol-phosphate geranylgeranyltransferase [Candidatus Nanoarchaeia archaeon]|nr:geranylgeranylglycerol-phosphate geranylgeranyltransferase [Candidatus Nanoarchaeia archaeon]